MLLTGCASPITREQVYLEAAAERVLDQEAPGDPAAFCSPDVRFEVGLERPLYEGQQRARWLYELYAQHTSTPCGDSGRNGIGARLRVHPFGPKP